MAGQRASMRAQEPDYKSLLIAAGVCLPEGLADRICALRRRCLEMEQNRERLAGHTRRRMLQARAIASELKRLGTARRMIERLDHGAFAEAPGEGDTAEFATKIELSAIGQARRALLRGFDDLRREMERERDSLAADTHPRFRRNAQKRGYPSLFKALGYEPGRVGWQPEFRWFFGELIGLIESECKRDKVLVQVRTLHAVANALFPDVQHSEEAIKLARTRALRAKMTR